LNLIEGFETTSKQLFMGGHELETFEKCPILFKAKEGENFNHRNTLSISRIKI
jgi:hypothetical protein